MKKGLKIFAGIGCGLVLIGGAGILLLIVGLNVLESRLDESYKPFETEGSAFGSKTDQQGCIDESLRRSRTSGLLNIDKGMETLAFTEACLKTGKPTPGFCDGVPSYWSTKDTEWKVSQCRKAGMDEEKTGCVHVFKAKHNHCSPAF